MTEIKSHEFDRLLGSSASHSRLLVIFGPDAGLVSERAQKAALRTKVPLDDPFSHVSLTASDLTTDPGRLVDEANAIGLFGGEKLVWIKGVANEKPILDGLAVLAEDPPESAWVIIEAGDLKKNAGLRKLAAAQKTITSVPCYSDDGRALNALIDEVLDKYQLRISQDARSLVLSQLGGDRRASRNEIEKLALYCANDGLIEHHHVTEIIGDASGLSVDDAVNAVFEGQKNKLLHAFSKITASKTPVFLILQAVLKQFQMLDLLKSQMDANGLSATATVAKFARNLHFKKKPIVERALHSWTQQNMQVQMNRLQTTILQSRQNATIEESVAFQLLLSITLQSNRANASGPKR